MGSKEPQAPADNSRKAGEPEETQAKPPAVEEKLESLETFIAEEDPETVAEVLADPEVQSLLQELQMLLLPADQAPTEGTPDTAAETADASLTAVTAGMEAADSQLFVPLTEAANEKSAAAAVPGLETVDAAEAARMLQQLQEALKKDGDPKLKEALSALEAAVTKAAEPLAAVKPTAQLGQLLQKLNGEIQTSETPSPKSSSESPAASPLHKLEALAVKHPAAAAVTVQSETAPDLEEPLFAPLQPETGSADGVTPPPATVQDLMKQLQSGQPVSKLPTLQMPAESFPDDMTQFVMNSFLLDSGADGITEAKLSLYPQHLGHVEVKLTMQNGQLIAQFAADNAAGKDMLESQLAQLRHSLQSQGIQVEKLEVTQSSNAQGFQSGMFQEKGQGQQPQSRQNQKAASARIAALEGESFTEELASNPAAPARTGSGMIDVIA
ncbi:flagellar hook-length control protein FliK [Paenibacillus sp. S-38]|uniref:flagellar hook-length control protein FliK n=1 Tax=Paenibacillus sp. S-38 TaxID=3416710 RepID=UPI003CE986A4